MALALPVALLVVKAGTRPAAASSTATHRTVLVDGPAYRGLATWYGPGFDGRRTASGEVFRADLAMTAAHRWLPFGTLVRVCTPRRCVVVRINDRGPFGRGRIIDLSRLAARRLGMEYAGVAPVTVTVLQLRRVPAVPLVRPAVAARPVRAPAPAPAPVLRPSAARPVVEPGAPVGAGALPRPGAALGALVVLLALGGAPALAVRGRRTAAA